MPDSNNTETMTLACRECGHEYEGGAWKHELHKLPLEGIKLECKECKSEQWFKSVVVHYCQPVKNEEGNKI